MVKKKSFALGLQVWQGGYCCTIFITSAFNLKVRANILKTICLLMIIATFVDAWATIERSPIEIDLNLIVNYSSFALGPVSPKPVLPSIGFTEPVIIHDTPPPTTRRKLTGWHFRINGHFMEHMTISTK